jgi:hypothetical protein
MAATMPITSISRSPSTLSAAGPRKGAAADAVEGDNDEEELLLLGGAAAGSPAVWATVQGSNRRQNAVRPFLLRHVRRLIALIERDRRREERTELS